MKLVHYTRHTGYGWTHYRFAARVEASQCLWRMECNECVWMVPGTVTFADAE